MFCDNGPKPPGGMEQTSADSEIRIECLGQVTGRRRDGGNIEFFEFIVGDDHDARPFFDAIQSRSRFSANQEARKTIGCRNTGNAGCRVST